MPTCRALEAYKKGWRIFRPAESPAALFLVQVETDQDGEEHPLPDRRYQMKDGWGGDSEDLPWVAASEGSLYSVLPFDLSEDPVIGMLADMTMAGSQDTLLERLDAARHHIAA